MTNRRKHFLINKPLQLRFMFWVLFILLSISSVILCSVHFGVWGRALNEFSDESISNSLKITSLMGDYERARFSPGVNSDSPRLDMIRETELFSMRQRESINTILKQTNKQILLLSIPLIFLIGWATIFLSHKVAGPLYRINIACKQLKDKDFTQRIHLRKRDEGQETVDLFNAALDELEKTVSEIKKTLNTNQPSDELRSELLRQISQFKTR